MNKKRVAIYLRVSTDEQAKHGISLDSQLKKTQDYCEFKDWEIFKVYRDEGISGGSTKKRKAFQQMIKDSKEKKFSAILVTKIDRAFRNVIDALLTLENLRDNGTDFVSISEDIDTTTPMGKAMFTIISVFAQLEREMNTGRVRDVRTLRFEQGMFPARSPYGYRPIVRDKKVVGFKIYPKEAEVVSGCFKMASEGKDYKEICSTYGLKPQQYYNILRNKAYCGYVVFEGKERKGIHEPIISEELFNKVNSKN